MSPKVFRLYEKLMERLIPKSISVSPSPTDLIGLKEDKAAEEFSKMVEENRRNFEKSWKIS